MARPMGPYLQDDVKSGEPIRAEVIERMPNRIQRGTVTGENITSTRYGEKTVLRSKKSTPVSPYVIDQVAELPPLPTTGHRAVFWYGDADGEGGTGDYQIWMAYAGQTKYYPQQAYTTLSGVPVE